MLWKSNLKSESLVEGIKKKKKEDGRLWSVWKSESHLRKKKDKKIDSEVVPWGKCEKVSQNEKSVKKILKSWI